MFLAYSGQEDRHLNIFERVYAINLKDFVKCSFSSEVTIRFHMV